jgi:hypothetical protein
MYKYICINAFANPKFYSTIYELREKTHTIFQSELKLWAEVAFHHSLACRSASVTSSWQLLAQFYLLSLI